RRINRRQEHTFDRASKRRHRISLDGRRRESDCLSQPRVGARPRRWQSEDDWLRAQQSRRGLSRLRRQTKVVGSLQSITAVVAERKRRYRGGRRGFWNRPRPTRSGQPCASPSTDRERAEPGRIAARANQAARLAVVLFCLRAKVL